MATQWYSNNNNLLYDGQIDSRFVSLCSEVTKSVTTFKMAKNTIPIMTIHCMKGGLTH